MKFYRIAKKGLIAGIFALLPFAANAGLMVEIDDLSTAGVDTSVSDNDVNDNLGVAGALNTTVSSGGSFFAVTAVSSSLVSGNGWLLADNTLEVNIAANSQWTIRISDDSYSGYSAGAMFKTISTPTSIFGVSVNLTTTVDGNVVFDGALGTGANQASAFVPLTSDPFTIEHLFTLTAGATSGNFFTADTKTVPEPTTLILLSFALLGIALAGRRKYFV